MSKIKQYDLLISPVITEKATLLSEENKVVFNVTMSATKKEISHAVAALFSVEVEAVNTLVVKGKKKRFRGIFGRRNNVKKAYVTLKDGHSIDITTGL